MTQKQRLQAKAYLRLSRQKDDHNSMRKQLRAVRRVIRHRNEAAKDSDAPTYVFDDGGWTPERGGGVFGDLHVDLDTSAFRVDVKRPAHAALMDLDDVDLIVVWEATRWDRRLLRFVASLNDLHERGIGFVSASQPDLDTTTTLGQLIVLLHGAFAQFESETISRRARESREERAERGYYVGGVPPVGYRRCTDEEQEAAGEGSPFLVQDEDEAEALRTGARLVLDGNGWTAAARQLNELGFRTRNGGDWKGPNLAKYLTAPATAGFVAKGDGFVRTSTNDRAQMVGQPVLDEATWNELKAKRGSRPGGKRIETLLHGIAVCASCGGSMRGSGSAHKTYACPRGSNGADTCSRPAIVKREALDAMISHYTLRRLAAGPVVEEPDPEIESRRSEIEEKLRHEHAVLERLREDRAAGVYDDDPEPFRHQHRQHTENVQALAADLDELAGVAVHREVDPMTPDEWERLPVGERRQIIRMLVEEVRVEKAGQGKRFDPRRATIVPTDGDTHRQDAA